ncbi:MAG: phage terminase large subunit [Candidatus Cybelea sp.]
MLDHSSSDAIAEAARSELARRNLLDFCKRTIPDFQTPRHIRLIAELLEAIERGDQRRLLITLHPGSGKSWLLQAFAAWYLGRHPRNKIIAASAGAELAERNSRASRGFFNDSQWPFQGVELSKATTAQNRWDTTAGGGLVAVGASGIVTGWRANLIIIDDAQNDALSVGERNVLWTWLREVLTPRLEPGGAIVYIQQRWGVDDIPGRILESDEATDWLHVRLPAIAEANDALGRKAGESLWPERWPLKELQRQRTAMGPRAFECAFLGNPTPLEGNLFRVDWFPRYDQAPTEFEKIVVGLDSAAKTGIRNDYSALVKIGVTQNAFYVLDVWRDKVELPQLVRRVIMLQDETPHPSAIYVEDTSNATGLIQILRAESTLPIVPVKAVGSKEARAESVTGTCEAKRVILPNAAPWLLDFERELFAFPQGAHDDQLDAFVMTLSQLVNLPLSMNWTFDESGVTYSDPAEQARFDAMCIRMDAEEKAERPDDIEAEIAWQERLAACGNHAGQRNALIMQREEMLAAGGNNRAAL